MTEKPHFEERENGPLVVKGVARMTGADGAEVEAKAVMALCRCGQSGNKPFCDGTHNEVGFQSRGGTPAGRDRLIAYEGAEVTVYYNPLVCSHAAECGRLAPEAFDPAQKPWVQPDKTERARLEAVAAACPSGAISLSEPGGEPAHRLSEERAEITVQRDGPYWVQGVEPPVRPTAAGASAEKYVLCRCGLSGNKPFCDGSHRDAGWKSGD